MPEFVEFSRDDLVGRREPPLFAFRARGRLSFNETVYGALGEPEAVALLFDASEAIIGLPKVEPHYPNRYQVRKQERPTSYLIETQDFAAHHHLQTSQTREFVGRSYGAGIWGFSIQGTPIVNRISSANSRALTSRWQHTTDGSRVPALFRLDHVAMSHPALARSSPDQSSNMRIGVLIGCEAVGAKPATTQLRSSFLALLEQPTIKHTIEALSYIEPDAAWTPYAARGRAVHEAVLTASSMPDQVVPTASALMLLPDESDSSFGGDKQYAQLIIDIGLRRPDGRQSRPAPLEAWYKRFRQIFSLPRAFDRHLSSGLGLRTYASPQVQAQLGLWLRAPHSMLDLVDLGDFHVVPGSPTSNWFISFAIAEQLGKPARIVAADMLRQMCDYTLHIDGYESLLAELSVDNARRRELPE